MKTYYRCPVCKGKTEKNEKSYICENKHLFDISAEGYVNFAAAKKGVSELSGDAADAIRARRSFLEKGYYKVLADALCKIINENAEKISSLVIDAGCGEGYYSRQIKQNCPKAEVYGIDLSKQGVKMAAKAEKNAEKKNNYCVAGIFDMPFDDESAGAVVSVFAPVADEEFYRVIEKSGILIVACPGKKHLYGLKEMLYSEALENEEKIPEIDAGLAASVFHFGEIQICDLKKTLIDNGINVRKI